MANNKTTRKPVARRNRKNIEKGAAHIHSSFNNTIVTITDTQGNAISWGSAGELGFKGSRKSTPFAAGQVAETAAKAAEKLQTVEGIKEVNDGMENPSPELKITVNKEKAMLNGLTVAQIYAEIAKNISSASTAIPTALIKSSQSK